MKLIKLTNREIVEVLYFNDLILSPRINEIGLRDGRILVLQRGELYWKEKGSSLQTNLAKLEEKGLIY